MQIGLLSDTHGHMDERILHHLQDCDEIWHAGDIGALSVTEALQQLAPLRAVWGNIDGREIRQQFPEHQHFVLEGVKIWMTHIGGTPPRFNPAIRPVLKQEKPQLFVCGHSHILRVVQDPGFEVLYLNPGAAGRHGFHKMRTLLRFRLEHGGIKDMQAIELGARARLEP
ncbi:metallophosphoesterase family protein [Cesiribacter andamanensis]|uniref:Phosphoesterase n=1 Tax=Cesiribacter andamanensis AMV16 TaxID=1279009 RepID=M7N3B8_9BACT|nr:metallophosphoesterase family protein [Cesiribacter andamanensis]EMR03183.1 phosphodiesterase [Cesiribacter andamanensis AMV16]